MRQLRRFWRDEDGVTTVETALIVVILTLAAYTGYASLGGIIAQYAGSGAEVFQDGGP